MRPHNKANVDTTPVEHDLKAAWDPKVFVISHLAIV